MKDYNFLSISTRKITTIALFSSLAIILSVFESLLPTAGMLPPGVKFGFSNIAVMFVAESMGLFPALLVSVLKSTFVLSLKGPMAFLMSFFGGIFSVLSVWVLLRLKKPLSFVFISVGGAMVHSITQLYISSFILSKSVLCYFPILLLFSVISGTLTGVSLRLVLPALKRSLQL